MTLQRQQTEQNCVVRCLMCPVFRVGIGKVKVAEVSMLSAWCCLLSCCVLLI